MTTPMIRALVTSLALLLAAAPATAWDVDDAVELSVLPGWRQDDGTHMAALRISLAPGWKTYWRAPGDAGIPPEFHFAASDNLSAIRPHWPVPEIFEEGDMRSIGYSGELVLPLELVPDGPGAITLQGEVELGICEEICVPVRLSVSAALPAEGARDGTIVGALVDAPMSAAAAGVTAVSCRLRPAEQGLELVAELSLPPLGPAEEAAIEAGPGIWVSEPQVSREGDRLRLTARLIDVAGRQIMVERAALRLTLFGGGRAVDVRGCPAP
ncbi:protein-disulfide reductase DsbD domain-containing protein [Pseudoroseicyclus tamaricis]|uniref:protein-disulfide reductase DsbD domain-containing protein n=2 Tax=Pseudoroseicyclus tamaricis TaxID=2705421 RepID=UPI001F17996E|nr:protein-disulfide reductase DsbD domain-containing protein [Pseudoroseicyclus tamaricis]